MMNHRMGQRGQVAVEYILLTVTVVAVALLVRNQISQRQVLAQFVQAPWAKLSGVIENGVLGDPAKTKAQHPNLLYRHASLQGTQLR
jgi:hypothetical protein